jgi:hypothetical protein
VDERDERRTDDVADPDLAELLGRYADDLTGRVDVEAALEVVQRRARSRRRWRVATSTLTAAAAAVVLVAGTATLVDDDQVTVRSPDATGVAAAPSVASTAGPTVPTDTTTPATVATTPPTAPPTSLPASPGVAPTTQPATTTTFAAIGGSIVVRLAGEAVALDREPSPAPGWTVRIDDAGPTRVRVRFERDGQRSEIRVEVRDGELVPQVVEQ